MLFRNHYQSGYVTRDMDLARPMVSERVGVTDWVMFEPAEIPVMTPRGPREYAARNQAAGAFASGIRTLAEKANEMSLTHWLQVWLRNNEPHIIREMDINRHSVFVAQFNYTVTDGEVRTYMVRGAYLLGTVASRADIGKILTPEALYGPSMRETVPNGTLYQIAYLVGGRKQVVGSAGKTGSASSLVG